MVAIAPVRQIHQRLETPKIRLSEMALKVPELFLSCVSQFPKTMLGKGQS
jgi:hypothetical protein